MASYEVQEVKFRAPQPELGAVLHTATILGEHNSGWSAVANEDTRMVAVKVRAFDRKSGKTKTRTFRFPFESMWYVVYTAKAVAPGDEPADPK